ncbi:MAG: PBSX family phage terminase large subunit [Moraxellaceae bacterium]|nr:MAG: PBSX family phage terminase large subunit [Moraxellaceae bacterium]
MGSLATATLNPILRDFWQAPARNKVLYGGRASSKSWDAAGFAIFLADNYKLRFLCARQFQNKIEESVYSLLKIQIERFGLQHRFKIMDNKIINRYTGTEFLFYGLWRHIDEIKSLESIDVCWLEEAHNITQSQWEILEPTVRKEHSQFWIIFNPKLATDFVYKRFVLNPPPKTVVRQINYTDNPFLSQTMRDVIEAAKLEDFEEYQHIYLGVPRDDDDNVIIKRSWVQAAIEAHVALGFDAKGAKRLGFDIADSGADKCSNVFAHGSIIRWTDEWKAGEDELLLSCTRTYVVATEHGAQIIYDSIGVGASAGAKFNELNATQGKRISHTKFNAGAAVWKPDAKYGKTDTLNRDMFSNIKAQAWWLLADRFRNTYNAIRNGQKFNPSDLISIASDCPNLDKMMDELSTPKRDYAQDGRVKVESKKDLAKRDVPSPNIADAVVMAFTPTIKAAMVISSDSLSQI